MRPAKAQHRAAVASLDGHVRFVVLIGHTFAVYQCRDLARDPKARIERAYADGRAVDVKH